MLQGCDDSAAGSAGRATLVTTGLLALALTMMLGAVAWTREGNLAWDDADYLRRALQNVDRAGARGPLGLVPALVNLTLKERPKPPLLVAWIEVGRLILGRRDDLRPLIVVGTAVPFGLLLAGAIVVGRRLGGPSAALVAVVALAASPMALAFGAKVMVETFMGLWTLLALAALARLIADPTPRRGVALGVVIGLALMTKLTVALLLPWPCLAAVVLLARRHALDRRDWLRLVASVALPAALVAGPWFARNGRAAVEFAAWSSRYQQVAEDRSDIVPTGTRLLALASQLAGWPLVVLVSGALLVGAGGGMARMDAAIPRESADFVVLTALAAVGGTLVLLRTSYFDPRFLLPVWASIAVALGVGLVGVVGRTGSIWRRVGALATVVPLLGLGLVGSVDGLRHEPRNATFWATRQLLDDLVAQHRVATIGNLGNCAEWNVCKTALINELRANARACSVLFDVSQWSTADIERRLDKLDAVLVLEGAPLSDEVRASAPGLNRGYDPARTRLRDGGRFDRVGLALPAGFPAVSVYVRRR